MSALELFLANKIKNGDLRMVEYFWKYKDDPERYTGWEEILPALKEEYPQIVKAWEDYKAAKKAMDDVIEGLEISP